MKRYISLLVAGGLLTASVISCTKEYKLRAITQSLDGMAYLKVIDIAPGFRQVFNSPDTFNIFIGANKINSPFLTYNGSFPALAANTNTYSAVPSGDQELRLTLRGIVNTDSLSIVDIHKTMQAGNYYTFLITDSVTTTSDYSKIWVKDVFSKPDTAKFSLRFIHAVMNDTTGKKVDVYSMRQASNVFTNVGVNSIADFTTLPYNQVADTLIVRRSGTTQELARLNNISFSNQRVYTAVYKGSTIASGTKGKSLIVYSNY